MSSKSLLKLPNQLNLGSVLPGQYGQIVLPLRSPSVTFANLALSSRSVNNGYFLLRQGTNDCKNEISLVIKPGTTVNIIVASYPEELFKTTTFTGELEVSEQGNVHTIKLCYKVELPRILCKKMLQSHNTKERMIRIIINKAVTNEGRIMLTNQEEYPLQLQPDLLLKNSIQDKNSPFLMKVNKNVIEVDPKQQFVIFLSLSTNIGFKQEFKGMKKCVMRNVLILKTNSTAFWCLPLEIIVIFVKQPEMKEL